MASGHAHFGELGGEGLAETGIDARAIGQRESGELFLIEHSHGAFAGCLDIPSRKNKDGVHRQGDGILVFENLLQVLSIPASLFESVAILTEGELELASVENHLVPLLALLIGLAVFPAAFRFDDENTRRGEKDVIDVPLRIVLAGEFEIVKDEAIPCPKFLQPRAHQKFAFEAEAFVPESFEAFGGFERAKNACSGSQSEGEPKTTSGQPEATGKASGQDDADGVAETIKSSVLYALLQAPSWWAWLTLEGLAFFGVTRREAEFHIEQEADERQAGGKKKEPIEFWERRKGFGEGEDGHWGWDNSGGLYG